ncbi:arginine--tRNA ligase [Candidatus Peregrinibacteria bacterium]|nr:arginine--tRNA ligase [Candidatus Peregrinibacteria bacterium]
MNHPAHLLRDLVYHAAIKAGFTLQANDIRLERTKTLQHGHFATNLAMNLAGKLSKKPRDVAEAIARELKNPLIQKIEISGPGFINLWIEQKFYTDECHEILNGLDDYINQSLGLDKGNKKMLIDYSHPNIAKPMGVHHLLSTIIGDSIKRIYQAMGWTVVADNFIGDMGTQFGKLIHAIKTWGNLKEIEKDPIPNLLKLYVQFHFEADKDVELDDAARAEYKKFEQGDPESRQLWKKIVRWSFMEIQPVYDRLGVQFDHLNGESFYEDKMPAILKQGRSSDLFTDGQDGAWIVLSDNPDEPPAVIRKKDGVTLYITRDLARIAYWEKEWHPERMVNVVDVAQEFYFRQLFGVAEKMKLTPAKNVHVAFGRMQFKDGWMSTRKGNIILLNDLLDEAEARALKLAREKGTELTPAQQKELARVMGIGAVKYNILSQNRLHNMTFDWNTMLSFEGNSAPYLMYTAARAQSVLRKGKITPKNAARYELSFSDDRERILALDLTTYPETIRRAADEYKPSFLATHLYTLAQDFNAMYNDLKILQAESDASKKTRLLLTGATVEMMQHGLSLLGIEVPEKM